MDREFIEKNQIVERYLSGRLPVRGAADFERFCRENPEMLEELGLPARVHAGVKLLDASGQPEPWAQPKPPVWLKPRVLMAVAAAAFLLLVTIGVLASKVGDRGASIAALQKRLAEQPLEPMTVTRTIKIIPSRDGPIASPMVSLGSGVTEFADLKIDLSWTRQALFRLTIDRDGQGRVAQFHQIGRDSNGDMRIAFNTSVFGPGVYHLTLDGIDWRGQPQPMAWVTLAVGR